MINGNWGFQTIYTGALADLGLSSAHRPAWSPDGKQVFFGSTKILGYNLETKKAWFLTKTAPDPVMGQKITRCWGRLMVHNGRLLYFAGRRQRKTPDGKLEFFIVTMSVPFAGGKPIPFLVQNQQAGSLLGIHSNPPEALYQQMYETNLFRVPGLPPKMGAKRPHHKLPAPNNGGVTFSADWKRVAIGTGRGAPWKQVIYEMPNRLIATLAKTRNVHAVSFSPDGSHLAAVQIERAKPSRIVIIPLADPTKEYVIFDKGIEYTPPSWSPDGRHIAFVARYSDGMYMGRMRYSRKCHIVRLLAPQAAGDLAELDKKIAAAKKDYDAAFKYYNSLDHDQNTANVQAATKRLQAARKKYDDLVKQRETLRAGSAGPGSGGPGGRPTGGPVSGGVVAPPRPSADYSRTLGKPTASFRTFTIYLFRSVLHRDPTGDELYHCQKLLKVGKSRYKETRSLLYSQAYKARNTTDRQYIRDAYQAMLGREPTRAETNILQQRLKTNPDRLTVLDLIASTQEHQKIQQSNAPTRR